MAAIKTTTPTKFRLYFVALAVALLAFASINIFSSFLPSRIARDVIAGDTAVATSLPYSQRIVEFANIRERQEALLLQNPSDPFAWARLAYLRLMIDGDKKSSFAALRMSDLVAPDQSRLQFNRAIMWYNLRDVEDEQQRAYQQQLWQKAFRWNRKDVALLAKQHGLVNEISEAMKTAPSNLYDEWLNRAEK